MQKIIDVYLWLYMIAMKWLLEKTMKNKEKFIKQKKTDFFFTSDDIYQFSIFFFFLKNKFKKNKKKTIPKSLIFIENVFDKVS
jgi:hypothetical protein